jgi:hypothetical protein
MFAGQRMYIDVCTVEIRNADQAAKGGKETGRKRRMPFDGESCTET